MVKDKIVLEEEELKNEIFLLKQQNEDYIRKIEKLKSKLKDSEGILRKAFKKVKRKE